MFCSGSGCENVRAGPASYVVFGARKLTSKRSRSGNAVRSEPCLAVVPQKPDQKNENIIVHPRKMKCSGLSETRFKVGGQPEVI